MKLVGFLIVFACLVVGGWVVSFSQLPLPPSVIGLLLLFILLQTGVVKLEQVQALAKVMLDYLAFLILPACISIMQYLDVIRADALPLVVATTLSTLIVMYVSAKTHNWVRLKLKPKTQGNNEC